MAAVAKSAKPARFVSPRRRAMEGKVHVAKKEMGIDEDTYRGMMMDVTGKASLTQLNDREVEQLVEHFKAKGWQAKPKSPPKFAGSHSKGADHPTARKARALWISLYQLGAIENASERALETFVKRQMGIDRLAWANQGQMDKVIEGLIAIGRRHGWDAKQPNIKAIKVALAEAILAKLKAAGYAADNWTMAEAADRITGFVHEKGWTEPGMWDDGDLTAITAKFAHLLKTGRKD